MTKSAAIWWDAIRPKTLMAALAPVGVGSALARAQNAFDPGVALAALVGALGIQIGTNLFNDWSDFRRGADTAERLGPVRALQRGLLLPRDILLGTAVSFAVAIVAGLYLLRTGGMVLAAVGIASLTSGLLYTGGPFALAYTGLADIFVFVFFGPVAVGTTAWLHGAKLSPSIWLVAAGLGLLTTAILVVNNLRDFRQDASADKRTLAVRFGPTFSRVQYTVCVSGALVLAAAGLWGNSGYRALGMGLLLPPALGRIRAVWHRDGAQLNPLLAQTAKLEALFAALISALVLF